MSDGCNILVKLGDKKWGVCCHISQSPPNDDYNCQAKVRFSHFWRPVVVEIDPLFQQILFCQPAVVIFEKILETANLEFWRSNFVQVRCKSTNDFTMLFGSFFHNFL